MYRHNNEMKMSKRTKLMSERASSVQRKSVKGFLKAFISIAHDHLKTVWLLENKRKKEMYIYNYLMIILL